MACKATSIAATIVPTGEQNTRRLVVYFIGEDTNLYSANAVLQQSPVFVTPAEKPSMVGDGFPLQTFAQLSLYSDEDDKQTIIYALNSSDSITPINDPWSNI